MKTLLKNTALICLLILTFVCTGLFAACGGDDKDDTGKATDVTYTVLVEDDAHNPVKDVSVRFGKGGTSYDPVTTGADGKATISLPEDTYSVKLVASTLPDGYNAPENIQVTKDNHSVTVTLVKEFRYVVNLVDQDGNPFYLDGVSLAICGLEENSACADPHTVDTNGKWSTSIVTAGNYKVQIIFPEGVEGLYSFTGSDVGEGHYYTGETFTAEKNEMTIIITAISTNINIDAADTYEVKILHANSYATVNFTAPETGVYEISSEGDFDTRVEYSAGAHFFNKSAEDDDSGEGKNFKLGGIEFQNVGPTCAFHIYVKDGTFPATFNVKIVRTGDATPIVEREYQKITPAEIGTEPYGDGSGVFTAFDLSAAAPVKGADDYYHVGAADGPVLVAKLDGSFRNIGEFTEVNGSGYLVKFIDITDETAGWDYIDFWNDYTELCNSDGVYPVNDEIKLFLQRWATEYIIQYPDGIASSFVNMVKGNEWLIPCGYYAEGTKPPEVDDVIVGEYSNEEGQILTVAKDGTYSITEENMMGSREIEGGTWAKNSDNNYTFTYISWMTGTYTVTRDENGTLTFVEDLGDPADQPYYIFEVGTDIPEPEEDVIVGKYINEEELILTVSSDGTYAITSESKAGVMEQESGFWINNSENDYTFTCPQYEVIYTVTRDENGTLSFVEVIDEQPAEAPFYTFEVYSGDTEPEEDVIVGQYTSEEGYILTVSADNTYTITEENMIEVSEVEHGLWIKNNENDYTFTYLSFINGTYTVTRDENGTLTFVEDLEEPNDEPFYIFEVGTDIPEPEEDVIVGLYVDEEEFLLTVFVDGTYEITSESKAGVVVNESGNWIKNDENNYTFSFVTFETVTYTVTRDENGTLTFVEVIDEQPAEEPFYIFEVYSGEPVEDENDVVVGTYSNEADYLLTVYVDNTYEIFSVSEDYALIGSGSWIKNDENNYSFTDTSDEIVSYTVTRGENGTLSFVEDSEEPAGEPLYVFEVYVLPELPEPPELEVPEQA